MFIHDPLMIFGSTVLETTIEMFQLDINKYITWAKITCEGLIHIQHMLMLIHVHVCSSLTSDLFVLNIECELIFVCQ